MEEVSKAVVFKAQMAAASLALAYDDVADWLRLQQAESQEH